MHIHSHRAQRAFSWCFVVAMLAFCFFMAWSVWETASLRFQAQDTQLSLDTSRQRELKQQYEYDQVAAAIPETEAQLALVQPQTDAQTTLVAQLKAQRKELRAQKEALQAQLTAAQEEQTAIEAALLAAQAERDALQAEVDALAAEAARLEALLPSAIEP